MTTSTVSELAACPKCGNRAFIAHGNAPEVNGYPVWCVTDRCLKLPPRETEAEAIAAWNTRAVPTGEDTGAPTTADGLLRELSADLDKIAKTEAHERFAEGVYTLAAAWRDRIDAHLSSAPTTAPVDQVGLREAAEILDQYAAFVKTVRADDLELHPYQPAIEQAAEDVRAALSPTNATSEDTGASDAVERAVNFLNDFARADLDELAADGGVTVGMVFQQQARWEATKLARTLSEASSPSSEGSGHARPA